MIAKIIAYAPHPRGGARPPAPGDDRDDRRDRGRRLQQELRARPARPARGRRRHRRAGPTPAGSTGCAARAGSSPRSTPASPIVAAAIEAYVDGLQHRGRPAARDRPRRPSAGPAPGRPSGRAQAPGDDVPGVDGQHRAVALPRDRRRRRGRADRRRRAWTGSTSSTAGSSSAGAATTSSPPPTAPAPSSRSTGWRTGSAVTRAACSARRRRPWSSPRPPRVGDGGRGRCAGPGAGVDEDGDGALRAVRRPGSRSCW